LEHTDELTDREKRDIQRIAADKDYFYFLHEYRKTAAVSQAAVSVCGNNLEYVPEEIINRDICRKALWAKDTDCSILSQIPFPDIREEGIQRFTDVPAFVLYSFIDIGNLQMARKAVKADAYCLQLVPNELMTVDLCKAALQHPDADKKVVEFIPEKFRTPEIKRMVEEKFGNNLMHKETFLPSKKKGLSV